MLSIILIGIGLSVWLIAIVSIHQGRKGLQDGKGHKDQAYLPGVFLFAVGLLVLVLGEIFSMVR